MRNWKTNLGGAFHLLGTSLMGISLVPGSTDMHAAEALKPLLIAGFACNALGGFFGFLFAQDAGNPQSSPAVETETKPKP